VTLTTGKNITGANTQFKITGGSSGNVLTTDGSGALTWGAIAAGFTGVHSDVTSGSETYEVPPGVTKILVFLTGGGAGGGQGSASNEGTGGPSAGTAIVQVDVVAGAIITILIGLGSAGNTIGGDSTFTHSSGGGAFDTITAPGGQAGVTHGTPTAPTLPTIGASNEGIAVKGGSGSPPAHNATVGSASFWGGGGTGGYNGVAVASPAYSFGAGGGGGISTAGYRDAGSGADGCCFIMEFK
jgi:hypothetical protein